MFDLIGAIIGLPARLLTRYPAQIIDLPYLHRCPDHVADAVIATAGTLDYALHRETVSESTIDLSSDWATYLGQRSKNFRKNRRRAAVKLERLGDVEIIDVHRDVRGELQGE